MSALDLGGEGVRGRWGVLGASLGVGPLVGCRRSGGQVRVLWAYLGLAL